MTSASFDRLLLTGAAGGLGRVLRERMRPWARVLRVSDVAPLEPGNGDECVTCDLADGRAVDALLQDVDAVVHFGAISVERPFHEILRANIVGTFNVYEAARRHGAKRVVFASSNHVIGFYRQDQRIDADVPLRPDTNYGVSKAFGEQLARFYFDRYGIESVCLRIGSSFPEPRDVRMLTTWLSYDDLVELVRCALQAPDVGCTIVYGASANRDSWWDNRAAAHLGWTPRDSSEPFRARLESRPPPPGDPLLTHQGGAFVKLGPFEPDWSTPLPPTVR
jgi:uronate dehydrogenase